MSTRLRILAFNWRCVRHPQAGGSEINLFEQARRWVKDGHEVTVVCADPGREYASVRDEITDGIRVLRMGGRFSVYLFAALFLLCNCDQFDCILDVANGIPFFTPLFSRKPSVLLVHHVHGQQWFSEFPYLFATIGWFIERTVVPLLYRHRPVIAVSPTTRDALVELGFAESQIQIVYNGIKQPPESPVAPLRDGNRIAYVGRLKRYKRLDLLVQMVAALRPTFSDIHLDLAGDGDAKAEIEALIDRLGVRDCVTVHGFVDEQTKGNILRSAAVFATPSMHEGWGLSVIEANAYGCPAVAYDVPGLCVAICHNETGLLVNDHDSFLNALTMILKDQRTRDRLSVGAQAWAARFSWELCASSTLEVLKKCHSLQPVYITA